MSRNALNPDDPVAIAHLHAQTYFHRPATIVGTAEGLRLMRDAIDEALRTGQAVASLMAMDGEGYALVVLKEGPERYADWDQQDWGLPYTDQEITGAEGLSPRLASRMHKALEAQRTRKK